MSCLSHSSGTRCIAMPHPLSTLIESPEVPNSEILDLALGFRVLGFKVWDLGFRL